MRSRLTDRDWQLLDRLLAALMGVALIFNAVTYDQREGPLAPAIGIGVAIAISLLWRRSKPLVSVAVVCLGAIVSAIFLTPTPEMTSLTVSLILVAYSVAAHAGQREALFGLAAAAGTVLAMCIAFTPTDFVFPVGVFSVLPWAVGRALRNNTLLARELAEKAERAEHARADEERRAVAAERARVARELHDVLAHNLSVMVIQASAARRVVERTPEAAVDAADLIERTGRETLTELRRLFGPVRKEEGDVLGGAAGLDHLGGLVERARAAGLAVELHVEGTPPQVPAGVDATAYRLVQEALTNSLKHGGGASATVNVRYEGWDAVIEVLDDGRGSGGEGSLVDSGGQGLVGMRERVQLYGGRMEAGPRPGGGFAVRARLPLGEGALA